MLIFLIMIVGAANNQNKWKDFFHFHNFLGWKLNKDSIEKGEIIATSLINGKQISFNVLKVQNGKEITMFFDANTNKWFKVAQVTVQCIGKLKLNSVVEESLLPMNGKMVKLISYPGGGYGIFDEQTLVRLPNKTEVNHLHMFGEYTFGKDIDEMSVSGDDKGHHFQFNIVLN